MGTTGSAGSKSHSEGITSKNSDGIDSKNRAVDMPRSPISTEAATLNDEAVNSPTLLTQGCDSISVMSASLNVASLFPVSEPSPSTLRDIII